MKASLSLLAAFLLALPPARAADRAGETKVITAPTIPTAGSLGDKAAGVNLVAPLGLMLNTAAANANLPLAVNTSLPAAAVLKDNPSLRSGANVTQAAVPALAASAVPSSQTKGGQADHPSATASGGADHPLIEKVKEEARKLGTSLELGPTDTDTVARLGDMRTSGFTVLPAGTLVSAQQAANVSAAVDEFWKPGDRPERRTVELREEFKGWVKDLGGDASGRGGVMEIMETLTKALQTTLPEEDIELRDVQLRLGYQKHEPDALHVDGGYITATIALKGPGTLLYAQDANGGLRELLAPLHAAAVITNSDRRRAVNILGTVHSSPSEQFYRPGVDDDRWLLIVRYKRRGQQRAEDGVQQALKEEDRLRVNRVKRFREIRLGKPPPKRAWYDPRGWGE